jgi:glycerol-3-phosphate dehydrogenase
VSLFPPAIPGEVQNAREFARSRGLQVSEKLWERYGADAVRIEQIHQEDCEADTIDPEGFPRLEAQFRYSVRHQMVLSVEDFVRRRQPLHLCRADHGSAWYPLLERALKDELHK